MLAHSIGRGRGMATVGLFQGRVLCRHARDVRIVSDRLSLEEIRDLRLSFVEVMSMLGGTNNDWVWVDGRRMLRHGSRLWLHKKVLTERWSGSDRASEKAWVSRVRKCGTKRSYMKAKRCWRERMGEKQRCRRRGEVAIPHIMQMRSDRSVLLAFTIHRLLLRLFPSNSYTSIVMSDWDFLWLVRWITNYSVVVKYSVFGAHL